MPWRPPSLLNNIVGVGSVGLKLVSCSNADGFAAKKFMQRRREIGELAAKCFSLGPKGHGQHMAHWPYSWSEVADGYMMTNLPWLLCLG